MRAVAGQARESGKRVERNVDPERRRRTTISVDARAKVCVERIGIDQLLVKQFWIDVGDDATRCDFGAVGEHDPPCAPIASQHVRDGSAMEVQTRQKPVTTQPPIANGYTGLATCVALNSAIAARVGTLLDEVADHLEVAAA